MRLVPWRRRGDDAPAPLDRERRDGEAAVRVRRDGGDRRVVLGADRVGLACGRATARGSRPGRVTTEVSGSGGGVDASITRSPVSASWSQTDVSGLDEDRRGARDDSLGDLRDLLGPRDLAPELEEGVRALGLAPLGGVQARVLERDRCVPCEDLEHAKVVGVELVEAELRDHDDPVHARPELERHREERLLDLRRALDLLPELAVSGVADEQRLAGLGDAAGDARAR